MTTTTNFKMLNGTHLKLIALITMTLDHFAAVLLPYGSSIYTIFRAVGRISFPLYCFLLAEGYFHSRNHKAYLKRLFLFALISEIPFDMAFFGFPFNQDFTACLSHQNVFFTLFTGLFVLYLCDRLIQNSHMTGFLIIIAGAFVAEALSFDYGAYGVFVIFLFYAGKRFYPSREPLYSWILALLPLLLSGQKNGFMILFILPLLYLYNGQKGTTLPFMKYIFYAYYPVHLIIFAIAAII